VALIWAVFPSKREVLERFCLLAQHAFSEAASVVFDVLGALRLLFVIARAAAPQWLGAVAAHGELFERFGDLAAAAGLFGGKNAGLPTRLGSLLRG
jgi:hypothetical protein